MLIKLHVSGAVCAEGSCRLGGIAELMFLVMIVASNSVESHVALTAFAANAVCPPQADTASEWVCMSQGSEVY